MRTANPALNAKTFEGFDAVADAEGRMTLQGTVNKTAIMLLLLLAAACYTWSLFFESSNIRPVVPWLLVGLVGGGILGFVTVFKKTWAPVLAPAYAVCQGLVLGAISSVMELQYPGIVIQAVALTFGTLFCLLIAYSSGLIKPSENFRLGVASATGAIALIYIVDIGLRLFGIPIPFIHDSGLIGIAFSLFVVAVAALNLVLDFDFIENGAAEGAPRYMEWYGAFGLMVTLIWLYLEILRLLAKGRSRK
ncbi:MAG TPA: Bax inhibitor-1/YccA family protein [Bacteroidota bacterium]|nr:Bax inhibitor-1/YccA family protein [Bacteroidota bacterium]